MPSNADLHRAIGEWRRYKDCGFLGDPVEGSARIALACDIAKKEVSSGKLLPRSL